MLMAVGIRSRTLVAQLVEHWPWLIMGLSGILLLPCENHVTVLIFIKIISMHMTYKLLNFHLYLLDDQLLLDTMTSHRTKWLTVCGDI